MYILLYKLAAVVNPFLVRSHIAWDL